MTPLQMDNVSMQLAAIPQDEEILPSNTYRVTILSCRGRFSEPCFSEPGFSEPGFSEHSVEPPMDDCARPNFLRWRGPALLALLLFLCLAAAPSLRAQDWIKTGTGLGVEKVRLAVPEFKPSTSDAQITALLKVFNDTFWNDLDNSGIVELVSKSFYPLQVPGQPVEVVFPAWNSPPPNAAMLAFGNLGVSGDRVTVQGWLYDVKNTASPQVLGKVYTDNATEDAARLIAHKFADEIILRLGGGIGESPRARFIL